MSGPLCWSRPLMRRPWIFFRKFEVNDRNSLARPEGEDDWHPTPISMREGSHGPSALLEHSFREVQFGVKSAPWLWALGGTSDLSRRGNGEILKNPSKNPAKGGVHVSLSE